MITRIRFSASHLHRNNATKRNKIYQLQELHQQAMFWQSLASSALIVLTDLPARVSSAPLAQLGLLTGDNGPPASAPYAYHSCPNGGTWSRLEDDFTSFRSSDWVIETGARGVSTGPDGMTLDLSKDMAHTGGIIIAARSHWKAPTKIQFDLKTSGAPGIANAFIFKGEGQTGDEIDLEVVENTFQLPLWKDGVRLKKSGSGKDAKQDLRHQTIETSEYSYTYPTYNPTAWNSYELAWEPELVLWSVDDNERVQFLRKSDRFPTGPLPIRFGPWSTTEEQDWAGKVDWARYPHPKMHVRNFVVEGCRVD
ncbi:glycoside hydrolase family 16 protein [Cystobasidium minutum MCA 4210]|uniref:glycoside hydrolase family 16 protein n=1 Tax=Cystobasidium minutum MCA 4210 TaxID=1397322 RepID=UPI0034CD7066|eukprot:jgi/Rhomi1/99711/CE99710_221